MEERKAALISLCHGAGPLPALGDPAHASMIHHLNEDVASMLKLGTTQAPKAILVLTAHWQTEIPTISSGKKHRLLYDYHGFPREAYSLTYDADGAPDVAARVSELLNQNGFNAQLDSTRGWDHGTFIPMKLISPHGSVPIAQMSILVSQEAPDLLRMGKALAPLRDEGIAIIGSGSPSYHNLPKWLAGRLINDHSFAQRQSKWQEVLEDALQSEGEASRRKALENWRDFPHSLEMHPHCASEHFNTLLVCAGAAGDAPIHFTGFDLMGARQTTCYWD